MLSKREELLETVFNKAEKDAKTVVREGHTKSFIAERYLRRLKKCDKDKNSKFFGHGREMYNVYVDVMTTYVNNLRGPGIPYKGSSIPEWDSKPERLNI
ncbi:hypothetical protein IKG02_03440 [Candidatus Saccharibacteria bacterium]|nr:hypothetical protein [Candidatus Saccharibacteria bacterium]